MQLVGRTKRDTVIFHAYDIEDLKRRVVTFLDSLPGWHPRAEPPKGWAVSQAWTWGFEGSYFQLDLEGVRWRKMDRLADMIRSQEVDPLDITESFAKIQESYVRVYALNNIEAAKLNWYVDPPVWLPHYRQYEEIEE